MLDISPRQQTQLVETWDRLVLLLRSCPICEQVFLDNAVLISDDDGALTLEQVDAVFLHLDEVHKREHVH